MGANSGLHIIIFDELDAICKQRGSVASGAGVHDTVVNQLLSKIDGVKQLNNILVIGETQTTPDAPSLSLASRYKIYGTDRDTTQGARRKALGAAR